MEHSWILIVAMIGHVLCVCADRLLLCTPGGQFSFSERNGSTSKVVITKKENCPVTFL